MRLSTCCFFGHRTINETEELKLKLIEIIEKLIVDENIDGYLKGNYQYKHTWNRIYIDGEWYNVDIIADITNPAPYGFYKIDSYDSLEEEFIITRIY